MARTDPQIALRTTAGLKARVVASAKANNRSINAEITFQLQRAYSLAALNNAYFGNGVPAYAEIDRMASMAGNS